ncbi:hypothetical protein ACQRIT_002909 [Beauveria bassiana]
MRGPRLTLRSKIGDYLESKPPALPLCFTLAYILGQSEGSARLGPSRALLRDYLCELPGAKLSEDRINFFSLFHTLEVARLLHGTLKITEDGLCNPWKSNITRMPRRSV